jgi:hypothetical protein
MRMRDTLWLIQVCGDVEPHLHGPFKTDSARLHKARQLADGDEGTLIRLDIDAEGIPHVEAFSGSELPNVQREELRSGIRRGSTKDAILVSPNRKMIAQRKFPRNGNSPSGAGGSGGRGAQRLR